jgi:hypothetical protein
MRAVFAGLASLLLLSGGIACATPSGPSATDTQVRQLLAFQQWQYADKPKAGANHVDMAVCVARNTRSVDPRNPAWTASDPRWATVSEAVSRDCAAQGEQVAKLASALKSAMRNALASAYTTHLSKADADTLIRYYRSDEGRRYLDFQVRLSQVMRAGIGRAFGLQAAGGTAQPSADIMKPRMAMLQLSRITATQIVSVEDARSAGRDTTGAAAIAIMAMAVATSQGDALDELRHTYAAELPGFTAFVASPQEKQELRAFADADAAMVTVASAQSIDFDAASNGKLEKWRALYRSLPASGGVTQRQ